MIVASTIVLPSLCNIFIQRQKIQWDHELHTIETEINSRILAYQPQPLFT